jgi:hypothetical protein
MIVTLTQERSFFLKLYTPDGFKAIPGTDKMLYLERKTGHYVKAPTVYGRVTHTHPICELVKVGDLVVWHKTWNQPKQIDTETLGRVWWSNESRILGVCRRDDGSAWFQERSLQEPFQEKGQG